MRDSWTAVVLPRMPDSRLTTTFDCTPFSDIFRDILEVYVLCRNFAQLVRGRCPFVPVAGIARQKRRSIGIGGGPNFTVHGHVMRCGRGRGPRRADPEVTTGLSLKRCFLWYTPTTLCIHLGCHWKRASSVVSPSCNRWSLIQSFSTQSKSRSTGTESSHKGWMYVRRKKRAPIALNAPLQTMSHTNDDNAFLLKY